MDFDTGTTKRPDTCCYCTAVRLVDPIYQPSPPVRIFLARWRTIETELCTEFSRVDGEDAFKDSQLAILR